jgi:hypothetical protein
MKSVVVFVLLALSSTSAFANVSCENDRICSGTQSCVGGYCVEKNPAQAYSPAQSGTKERNPDSNSGRPPVGTKQIPGAEQKSR